MNKEVLKRLILETQERDVKLIKRDVKINFIKKINVIIGPRRAGKTFFLYQIMNDLRERGLKDRILYINFEDERLYPIKKDELQLILDSYYELFPENKRKKVYVFLDEIQLAPMWQKFIRRVNERENVEICVTGSSSKLLSKEIATELRGRTLTYFIYPYSFKEFLKSNGIKLEKHWEYKDVSYKIKKLLKEYITFGGFPETVNKPRNIKIKLLQEYYETIFYKDVVDRYKIKNFNVMRQLMKFLVTNFSNYFSMRSCYKFIKSEGIKISKNTLTSYLSYLEDCNFLFSAPKYSYSLKEQIVNPKKIYMVDNGFITATAFSFSENLGRLYENVVFLELKRREMEIYYWKNKREVDFVIKEGPKIKGLIQVCCDIQGSKKREVEGLLESMKKFRLRKGLIITKDYCSEEKIGSKKIVYRPLWRWILE